MLPPDELAGFSGVWGKHTHSYGTNVAADSLLMGVETHV